jgi:hypothetical protein
MRTQIYLKSSRDEISLTRICEDNIKIDIKEKGCVLASSGGFTGTGGSLLRIQD